MGKNSILRPGGSMHTPQKVVLKHNLCIKLHSLSVTKVLSPTKGLTFDRWHQLFKRFTVLGTLAEYATLT